MKNFFKNLWDKIKNFVSRHKSVFEDLSKMLLGILYIAWAIFMLYASSQVLLLGLKEESAMHITVAVAGYIFVAWYTYWVTFSREQEDNFLRIWKDLWRVKFEQEFNSTEDALSRLDFKFSVLDQKMSDDAIKDKLEVLERKLDKLISKNN